MTTRKVAQVDDVTPEKMVLISIDDRTQIVLANLDGEIVAFSNICSHADCDIIGGPFEDPPIEFDEIDCTCHYSRFNVRTGKVMGGPAAEPLPVYPVTIEDGAVFVELE